MALGQSGGQLSAREQQRLGLPEGWKKKSALPFGGMNLSDSRFSINDAEFSWLENWVRVGAGRLQTTFDAGPGIYDAPGGKTISSFFFYTLNAIDYVMVFFSDGTANQVRKSNGATTVVSSTPGTFGSFPACAQWGTQYLLVSNSDPTATSINQYWCWDGALLYTAGTLAPQITLTAAGMKYTSAPTVTAFGGSGSGATFSATVSAGSVVNILPTSPGSGYQVGDIVQLEISGGGSDTSAHLNAVVTGQAILQIVPVLNGSGYTSNPSVAVTGGGGSVMPTVEAVLGSGAQAGQVVEFILITPGSADFTGTPTITLTGGGGTSAATATAIMTSGVVVAVNVAIGGTGFQGTPGLTFVGGGGSGATAQCIMSGGSIASVQMITGGQGYDPATPPAVVVDAGINNAAAGTVTLMPYGISGSAISTYLSRVELVDPLTPAGVPSNGGTRLFSAPDSFTDFATSDGGLIIPTTESNLRRSYVGLQISGGYLYYFGDTSISVLSQITTGGSPTTTTLNYQTLDTQSGTPWRDSIASVGRDLVFANQDGIWRLYGGTPTKLSEKIDPLFTAALPLSGGSVVSPTAAVTTFMSRRIYLLNMTTVDPRTDTQRTVLIGLDEGRWHIFSQSIVMKYIGTFQSGSTPQAYGTDGNGIFPLLAAESATLVKSLSTRQWGVEQSEIEKEAHAWFVQAQAAPGTIIGLAMTVDIENASYAVPGSPVAPPDGTLALGPTGDVVGLEIGLSLTITANNVQLLDIGLAGIDIGAVAGNM